MDSALEDVQGKSECGELGGAGEENTEQGRWKDEEEVTGVRNGDSTVGK